MGHGTRSGDGRRKTEDNVENKEGKLLIEVVRVNGWEFLNGNKTGDEEGKWTYMGARGETVIDYGIVDQNAWDEVTSFTIGERTESDHMPLEIDIEAGQISRKKGKKEEMQKRIIWNEKTIAEFRRKMEVTELGAEGVENKIDEINEAIRRSVEMRRKKTKESKKRNEWWNTECMLMKREMRRKLKTWRKSGRGKQEFVEAKNAYKKKCEESKKRKQLEEEKALKSIKTEKEAWEYINKERRSEKMTTERIKMRDYFKELLGGTKGSRENEVRVARRTDGELQAEITREEVENQIRKLKKGKAAGRDGIQNEAWMYGTKEVRDRLWEIVNEVWMGGGFPRQWREGIICPIFKKGDKENVKNYRGITLLNTAYKVYAMCLTERLKEEVERTGGLPDGQAGFREGRGTMDNVYILKHIASKAMEKQGGKLYALFMDLKAAFDWVDREKLWECLDKRGISGKLINRLREIYRETKNVVRVNGKESEWFWTERGLRQGCPLSPLLFTTFISDMDDVLRRAQAGGVVVGKEKVWTLSYADDVVLVANDETGMREMIRCEERYMRKKGLEVNVEKTKMMVFAKGNTKRREWKWEARELEQVREFQYLGYMLNERNSCNAQVQELARKGNKLAGVIWGIGERKFGHDYKRRMMMFDSLIRSVLMYGAEIWGWKERAELEKVQERYIKWVMGLERETPGYIAREEGKREELRIEMGKRAVKFEDRMKIRVECKILQECWKQIQRAREKGDKTERDLYYEKNGFGMTEIERKRNRGEWLYEEMSGRDRDIERQERRASINESKYNSEYKKIVTNELPKYMERESSREKKMIARFRCGNEERENKYWLKEEERECRMCGERKETIDHLREECTEVRESSKSKMEILNERGNGLEWMKMIENRRKRLGIGEKR